MDNCNRSEPSDSTLGLQNSAADAAATTSTKKRTPKGKVQSAIRSFGPVAVVQLEDVPADGLAMPICGIGAPTISYEMLNNGGEAQLLRQEVERVFKKPVVAVMASEIGGSNGVEPVMWASRLGLPIVDADTMGRAFPEVQMGSFFVGGLPLTPIVLVDNW